MGRFDEARWIEIVLTFLSRPPLVPSFRILLLLARACFTYLQHDKRSRCLGSRISKDSTTQINQTHGPDVWLRFLHHQYHILYTGSQEARSEENPRRPEHILVSYPFLCYVIPNSKTSGSSNEFSGDKERLVGRMSTSISHQLKADLMNSLSRLTIRSESIVRVRDFMV